MIELEVLSPDKIQFFFNKSSSSFPGLGSEWLVYNGKLKSLRKRYSKSQTPFFKNPLTFPSLSFILPLPTPKEDAEFHLHGKAWGVRVGKRGAEGWSVPHNRSGLCGRRLGLPCVRNISPFTGLNQAISKVCGACVKTYL